jgi:hypothetical protein
MSSAVAGPANVKLMRRSRAVLLAALATSVVVSAAPAGAGAADRVPGDRVAGEVGEVGDRVVGGSGAGTAAGTIVYIKDYNVWIARGDGSGARALTTDGTMPFPYGAPSQSDAGIVVASYNKKIIRMTQGGRVLNTIDPPSLHTGSDDDIDGTPIDLAISPDGARIAYTFSQVMCSGGNPCSATGYTAASKYSPAGTPTYFWDPSWVSNTRTLQTGGWGSQVQLHDITAQPVHWFDDHQLHSPSTDVGDTELSPDGRHLAAIRGYGQDTAMVWYDVTGSAKEGPRPGLPELFCGIPEAGISGPTWAPDSDSLAWQEDDGIWTKSGVDICEATQRLLIPGGSEPDWSPAGLSDKPKPSSLRVKKRPAIAGVAKLGKKLTASTGRWSPAPSAYSFRWFRNGKAIKGGANRKHKVVRADRGKRLTVRVTARKAGYKSKTVTSAPRKIK